MMERHSSGRLRPAVIALAIVAAASLVATIWLSAQLNLARSFVSSAGGELEATQAQMLNVEAELAATRDELTGVEADLSASIRSLEADLFNLQVNYDRLITGYGYVFKDPSYQEMKDFLARDSTSGQEYVSDEYTCVDFAADIRANAAREGFRCAYVILEYPEGGGHTIVAFDTTDRGLVYIEPQFDWEVEPQVGERYHECVRPPHLLLKPPYDDTVTRIVVIW